MQGLVNRLLENGLLHELHAVTLWLVANLGEFSLVLAMVAMALLCLIWIISGNKVFLKISMIVIATTVAVVFGDQIVFYAPRVFDFLSKYLWEFLPKVAVIIVAFVFFAQIIAMVKKVIFSELSKKIFGRLYAYYVASATEKSHRFSRFVVYSVNVIKITAIEFYAIEEEDGKDEIVKKVATMEKWGLVDSIYDWSWSVFSLAMVELCVKAQFSLVWYFLFGWLGNNIKAAGAVKMAEAFDKDLSFGKAFRRVFDHVKTRSPWIAYLWMIWINTVGILWDGPDQVMYFYHKELNTVVRRWMFLLPATAVQAVFWIWAYSEGLEEAGDFIKYVTNLF
ncbi:MAG: hypothetical protein WC819_01900 [Parcubacteria group bacterium]|jgi:hypothetical protein